MQYAMSLLEAPFELIKSGKKTVEIRLFDEKRQKLKVGDVIEFSKLPALSEKMSVEVIALLRYKTFKSMIEDLGMECFGYSSGYSQDYFLDKIYSIYSKEQEQGYSVLGIRIKLIEQSY